MEVYICCTKYSARVAISIDTDRLKATILDDTSYESMLNELNLYEGFHTDLTSPKTILVFSSVLCQDLSSDQQHNQHHVTIKISQLRRLTCPSVSWHGG